LKISQQLIAPQKWQYHRFCVFFETKNYWGQDNESGHVG